MKIYGVSNSYLNNSSRYNSRSAQPNFGAKVIKLNPNNVARKPGAGKTAKLPKPQSSDPVADILLDQVPDIMDANKIGFMKLMDAILKSEPKK